MKFGYIIFLLGLLLSSQLFGSNGDWPNDTVLTLAIQQDGKALLGGSFTNDYLQRRNPDGTIDTAFTSSWTTSGFNGPVKTVAIQSNQKILVGGNFTRFDISLAGYIARFNSDGSVDTEFLRNLGVGFDDQVTSIEVTRNGKIWVAGKFSTFNGRSVGHLVRLNTDGTLDDGEISRGDLDGPVLDIKADPQDKSIWVGGSFKTHLLQLPAN